MRGQQMTATRGALGLALILMLAQTMDAAAAQDCKEIFIGRSRAADSSSVREGDKVALDGAIAHWRNQVRHAYGWDYRYWTSARAKNVRCSGNAAVRHCAVSARPCRRTS